MKYAMTKSVRRFWLVPVALFVLHVASPFASACSIPVFRYALERWTPDPYQLVVIHREKLAAADEQFVEALRQRVTDEASPVNLVLTVVDLNQASDDPVIRELAEKHQELSAPKVMLYYPGWDGPGRLAWSGPLSREATEIISDSPARREIAKRILDGQSAVWVLIESGDRVKDDAAEQILQRELARMEETLKLRSQEELAVDEKFLPDTAVKLKLAFSSYRLQRDDPQEAVFLATLLGSEPDLVEFQDPIAIPVFGRGRTYYALVGKGIHRDMIEDNCRFLVGDCSCEVKRQNPGMDLVFAVNWDELVVGSAQRDVLLPELTGLGDLVIVEEPDFEADPEEQTTRPQSPAEASPTELNQENNQQEPSDSESPEKSPQLPGGDGAPQESSQRPAKPKEVAKAEGEATVVALNQPPSPPSDSAGEAGSAAASDIPARAAEEVGSSQSTMVFWIAGIVIAAVVVVLIGTALLRPQQQK